MWRVALILVLAVPTAFADEPARPPSCSADALDKEGDDALAKGFFAQALDKYEKALRCEVAEKRVFKAGYVTCELYQRTRDEVYAKKAKRYYEMLRLQPNKDKLAQACTPRCRLE